MYACITCSDINPVYSGHREGQDELTSEVIVVDFRLSAHVVRWIIHQLRMRKKYRKKTKDSHWTFIYK